MIRSITAAFLLVLNLGLLAQNEPCTGPTAPIEDTVYSCGPITVQGITFTKSRHVVIHHHTLGGCDSMVNLQVIIRPIHTYDTISVCDSMIWQNEWIFESVQKVETWLARNGCDSTHTTFIQVNPSGVFKSTIKICRGEHTTLPNGAEVSEEGIYPVLYRNASGCDSLVNYRVTFRTMDYELTADRDKCLGEVVELRLESEQGFGKVEWSDGSHELNCYTRDTGVTFVRFEDRYGCAFEDKVVIGDAHCAPCEIFVPNAITIDGNYRNETFRPVHACEMLSYRFEVYSQTGQRVFETEDPEARWDGTYRGAHAPQDTYLWVVRYKDSQSLKPMTRQGTVLVLR